MLNLGFSFCCYSDTLFATDINEGLVGYWQFESNSGRTAYDSSGNGYHGYYDNQYGVLWGILGQVGRTTYFEGDNYFNTGDIDEFDFASSDSFTVSLWLKIDETVGEGDVILGKADTELKNGYVLRHLEDGRVGLLLESSDSGEETDIIVEGDYRDDQWHHFAVVVDREHQTGRIYVDTVLQERSYIGNIGDLDNYYNFNLGALGNDSNFFHGFMDEVRLYDRVVSETELEAIFVEENGEYCEKEYPAGSLLKQASSDKVYYINADLEKKWIINESVFNLYNNAWDDVIEVDDTVLGVYPSVDLMRARDGYRVYFIKNQTREWIESPADFENKGFDWSKVDDVLAEELSEYRDVSR